MPEFETSTKSKRHGIRRLSEDRSAIWLNGQVGHQSSKYNQWVDEADVANAQGRIKSFERTKKRVRKAGFNALLLQGLLLAYTSPL